MAFLQLQLKQTQVHGGKDLGLMAFPSFKLLLFKVWVCAFEVIDAFEELAL